MDMFTSYGHIKKWNKITDFLMILAWASPFNLRRLPHPMELFKIFEVAS